MNNPDKANVLALAKAVLDEKLEVIEGARKLAEFKDHFLADSNSDLCDFADIEVFLDVADETDGLPVDEDVKQLWAKPALIEKSAELEIIRAKYEDKVIQSCERLVATLTS